MPSKKRNEQSKRKWLQKASKNCKSLKAMFQASSAINETTLNSNNESQSTGGFETENNEPIEDNNEAEVHNTASTLTTPINHEKTATEQYSIAKQQPSNMVFPKTIFGKKERSFNASWFAKFPWIHYDIQKDSVFCYTCMTACTKGHKTVSNNRDPAFMTRGFRNWKKAGERFLEHQNSICHKDYEKFVEFDEAKTDIEEQLYELKAKEKAENRQILLTILRNVQYLGRQGLAFRGNKNEGNFEQLLKLSAKIDPRIVKWLEKKRNKYVHNDCQNEMIRVIAFTLLRNIAENINKSPFYSIMADEVTDSSNTEQLVICFRWIDENFQVQEDFVGIHSIENIKSDTIVAVIKDVLIRLNIPLSNCRGQCYDGASNMTGKKKGVSTQILQESPLAFLTHCYGHALNLAVGDMIKAEPLLRDTMDITSELSKLIKKSPKRESMLSSIRDQLSLEYPGFRVLCPTRWTVRADCLKSILDNWNAINLLWDNSLNEKLDPEIRGRIIGVKSQMHSFDFFFGIYVLQQLLRHSDNLSKSLQSSTMTACEGQALATLTVKTLEKMRGDIAFDSIWKIINSEANLLELPEPTMPRKRKKPARYLREQESSQYDEMPEVELKYKRVYFNAIDTVIACIKDRFNQPGFKACQSIEELLINLVNGRDYQASLTEICKIYTEHVSKIELQAQLEGLKTLFDEDIKEMTIADIVEKIKNLPKASLVYFSQVVILLKIMLVMPATNAISERSASCLRRIKNWLRTSMTQGRLNHCMLLSIHKEKTENVNLVAVANEFCSGNEERVRTFGRFCENDLNFKVYSY